jgi:hypothetical protein
MGVAWPISALMVKMSAHVWWPLATPSQTAGTAVCDPMPSKKPKLGPSDSDFSPKISPSYRVTFASVLAVATHPIEQGVACSKA